MTGRCSKASRGTGSKFLPLSVRTPMLTGAISPSTAIAGIAAARNLQISVHAVIVGEMPEEDTFIAQGQENNARLNTSFLEKGRLRRTAERTRYEDRSDR